ncbi:MAG: hypothetical protein IBX69_12925 [Anaerolineales bacterium]|nr:hypothetical protein [Anaerolineales bacterium]
MLIAPAGLSPLDRQRLAELLKAAQRILGSQHPSIMDDQNPSSPNQEAE